MAPQLRCDHCSPSASHVRGLSPCHFLTAWSKGTPRARVHQHIMQPSNSLQHRAAPAPLGPRLRHISLVSTSLTQLPRFRAVGQSQETVDVAVPVKAYSNGFVNGAGGHDASLGPAAGAIAVAVVPSLASASIDSHFSNLDPVTSSSSSSSSSGKPDDRSAGGTGRAGGTEHITTTTVVIAPTADSATLVSADVSAAGASDAGDTSTSSPVPPTTRGRVSKLAQRVASGVALGLSGGAIVVSGHYLFLACTVFVIYHATQEYYGLLDAKVISEGRQPQPSIVSSLTTVLCLGIAVMSYNKAKSGTILAISAFTLMVLEVVASKRPRFAQLASSVFGLFYCGWLPSFWIKLRNFPVAAPDCQLPARICSTLGVQWTVGLLATLLTVACIIAADTGAYFVGKNIGRTKLTDISPKKTVEGALGGLLSSVLVALAIWRTVGWPPTWQAAVGLGVVTFISSLFGDLIESIMKRDAGVKDSGNLIPGHGGLLDRFDSYMFSGAMTYFYVVFCLPWFGVAPMVSPV